jgi:hypothetical protein
MGHSTWHIWSIWLLKANVITWIINSLLMVVFVFSGSTLTGLVFSGYFSKITLLETGVAFLVAGALAFSGSVLPSKAKEYVLKSEEQWSVDKLKSSEKRANKFIILAAILLVESLLISFFGF